MLSHLTTLTLKQESISMVIYLYVKQHQITGLLYFGKTTRSDPYNYKGSGKYWLNHISKHGRKHVNTINVWAFEDITPATSFAGDFSRAHNIVESTEWANLRYENGLDGAPPGHVVSEETRAKQSNSHKGKPARNKGVPMSPEQKAKISASKTGYVRSIESRQKQSLSCMGRTSANKGRTMSAEQKAKISASQKARRL